MPTNTGDQVRTRRSRLMRMADQLARREIANLDDRKDRVGLLEEMIVGQVVFATVLTTLRSSRRESTAGAARFGEDRRD